LKTKVEQKDDKLEAKWNRKKQKLTNCRQQAREKDLHGWKRLNLYHEVGLQTVLVVCPAIAAKFARLLVQ